MAHDEKRVVVSRESRILLLTIVVCIVVLLALARLRFPDPPIVETAAQPLERLAARASYDALAADIERVETMISPNLVVLRTARPVDTAPRRIHDVLASPGISADVHHVAALRIDAGTALAAIDPDVRVDSIVGAEGNGGVAAVLAVDPLRRLGRVRVPEAPARQLTLLALGTLRTPVYVVAVEGTQAGVTLRPVFLGRGDRFGSARWTHPLLPLGGIGLAPGALLFSLSGEFIGVVVIEDGAPAVAGSRDVLDTIERLASSPAAAPSSLGVSVQALTPPLAAASGATRGVVVSVVNPDGPAAGLLRPADVITSIDRQSIDRPDQFLLHIASRPAGQPVSVSGIRDAKPLSATVVVATTQEEMSASRQFFAFERAPGGGTRATASGGNSGYQSDDLRAGDIVVSAGDLAEPTPSRLRRLLDNSAPDTPIMVTVRRDGEQRVVAVRVPARDDARE
jgi:hypothetical protein